MLFRRVVFAIAALTSSLLAQTRQSEKIACEEAPAAARAAARKQKTRQGTETACVKITENGVALYEFKVTTESGKMREVVFRPDGTLVEFEEEGDPAQIPPAAREAIQKAIAGGELSKIDVIHRGKAVLYEGEYRSAGAKKKVIVDAQGRIVGK